MTPRVLRVVGLAEVVAPLQVASVVWAAHPGGLVVMVALLRQAAEVVAQVAWVAPVVPCPESAAEPVASPPPESVAAGEVVRVALALRAVVVQAVPAAWARLAGRPSAARVASEEASGSSGIS